MLELLEEIQEGELPVTIPDFVSLFIKTKKDGYFIHSMQSVVDILSNVLDVTNLNGWISVQQVWQYQHIHTLYSYKHTHTHTQMSAGSRQLLDISERYGLYLSRTLQDEDNDRRTYQRNNVGALNN